MGSTQTSDEHATAPTVDLKLEVLAIPVSNIDRSKAFYEKLGWSLDADFMVGKDFRAVQLTPPGSPSSIHLDPTGVPGSAHNMFLVVSDLDAARRELIARGAEVSDVFHFDGEHRPVPGPDPQGPSYRSFASFKDPDGNLWLIQQVTTRLAGRGLSNDLATLTDLLREAEQRHGENEASAPKHHWSEWYAGFILARERGKTADAAAKDATRSLGSARGVAQT